MEAVDARSITAVDVPRGEIGGIQQIVQSLEERKRFVPSSIPYAARLECTRTSTQPVQGSSI
jgi:hypothetical protein